MTASRPEAVSGPRLAARIGAGLRAGEQPALLGLRQALPLRALAARRFVAAPDEALRGRTVLVRTRSPLAAAAALASLDGVAAQLVLCPPDLEAAQLPCVAAAAEAQAVVSDIDDDGALPDLAQHHIDLNETGVGPAIPGPTHATEWALFTSGTSGPPKMVAHSLEALTGAIAPRPEAEAAPVWATFYDVRRYGGLQMLLRALTGGASLLITQADEPLADFLDRVAEHGATHLAGTPSHWRRALMSPALKALDPRYVRLSGEIADQPVLDALRARFPRARIGHAYASTEAGVGFEVGDGLAGFPASLVERPVGPVRLRVVEGALQLRSDRAATGYLGATAQRIADADSWVDTGDLVELRGDRFHFLGRRSGVINVGGLKISPEEVEAVINACPGVHLSRVSGRASPLLGALVTAEVVLADPATADDASRAMILTRCRERLAPHKAPASLRFVEALAVGAAGKLERRHA